jgi:hypothetical protein
MPLGPGLDVRDLVQLLLQHSVMLQRCLRTLDALGRVS